MLPTNLIRTLRLTTSCAVLWASAVAGQGATDVNLPQAPTAPGFVLLGTAPMSVERPGNVTELRASVLSATDNFSALPRNYAIAVAPYWFFAGGRGLTYSDYAENGSIGDVFLQTASISIATSLGPDSTRGLGFGGRFSLFRGSIDTEAEQYGERLDRLYGELSSIAADVNTWISEQTEADSLIRAYRELARANPSERDALAQRIAARQNELVRVRIDALTSQLERAQKLASELTVTRIGPRLDVAGGAALEFPNGQFDAGRISRWGIWLNGGYEHRKIGALGVARVLSNPRQNDTTMIDLGTRLLLNTSGRFGFSGEFLWRQLRFGTNQSDDKFRVALNADIRLSANRSFNLTFGRDFNGDQDGSVVAIVEFVLGLASKVGVKLPATLEQP